jgi:hypothetical protein
LLHNFGEYFNQDIDKTGYIAVYYISGQHISLGQDILRTVKDKMQLPVILIGARSDIKGVDQYTAHAGPTEWLKILQRASFVAQIPFTYAIFREV